MKKKKTFFYGHLQEEIYVEQPPLHNDGTNHVCLFKKALYGLKQAPRIWFYTLSMFLEKLGFTALAADMGQSLYDSIFILRSTPTIY